jgi:hypothetical protein
VFGEQRNVFLFILSLILIAGSVIYFIKGDVSFAVVGLVIGIIFGVKSTTELPK